MALADYRLCDVCGNKAFYDSLLRYEDGHDEYSANRTPYRIAGEEQYREAETNKKHGMRLGYLGDWAVLCEECAKTHKTQIVPHGYVLVPAEPTRQMVDAAEEALGPCVGSCGEASPPDYPTICDAVRAAIAKATGDAT
ncbi:hypothetical protein [Ralstonia mannitolilytica]|uniref:hypothetical protein n=1 Tax=Ralstonia mannitolilytica TaxID=105219 RepID=UPI00142598C5|nr:hypothetical protein [Ralstonia mannitolilytica]